MFAYDTINLSSLINPFDYLLVLITRSDCLEKLIAALMCLCYSDC